MGWTSARSEGQTVRCVGRQKFNQDLAIGSQALLRNASVPAESVSRFFKEDEVLGQVFRKCVIESLGFVDMNPIVLATVQH